MGRSASAIDVGFTAADIRPADVIVVIDVLRATSTVAQALAAGYERVRCCETMEGARALRAPGRVIAGEREWKTPPGFDLGNSPGDFTTPAGSEVVLATTNGTPMMAAAAAQSDEVLLASLLNLDAIVAALPPGDVLLAGAGTNGRPALEDTYLAGRIASRLEGESTDAALIAEWLAGVGDPLEALGASADAAKLREAGLEDDVEWCAQESALDCVPHVAAVEDGVTIVELPDPTGSPRSVHASADETA
ncbi:MAG TPA: 2-phosphosulfolactate phosphatase [Thermoleophilaceae bacterium]|nr:2-phosphosulfolactate phosphatase [Thermoleophilaceae bacterium]